MDDDVEGMAMWLIYKTEKIFLILLTIVELSQNLPISI